MVLFVPDFVVSYIAHILLDNCCSCVVNQRDSVQVTVGLTAVIFIDHGEVKHVDKCIVDAVYKEGFGDSFVNHVDTPPGELIRFDMRPVSCLRWVEEFV